MVDAPVAIYLLTLDGADIGYLKGWDLEAHAGRGSVELTPAKEDAHIFPNLEAAWVAYRATSRTVPRRPDGKPNRPLTAYSASFEPAEWARPPRPE